MDRSFGEMLKSYRQGRGLSIEQVSLAIKVSGITIENIENENLDQLPKIVFTRGLIRTYCKYLEIDEEPVLVSFDEKTDYKAAKAKRIDLSEENHPKAPLFITFSRTFIPVAIILVLISAGYGIFFITQKYRKEISTVVTKNIQAIHTAKNKKTNSTTETDVVNSLDTDTIEENPKVSAESLESKKSIKEDKKSGATNAPKTEVKKITNTVTSETDIDPKKITQRLTLEPLAKTLIHIQLDNEDVQKIILRPDVNRTFQAKKTIKLTISDAGAVNIIHNSKDLGVPGIFGESINLEFPTKE